MVCGGAACDGPAARTSPSASAPQSIESTRRTDCCGIWPPRQRPTAPKLRACGNAVKAQVQPGSWCSEHAVLADHDPLAVARIDQLGRRLRDARERGVNRSGVKEPARNCGDEP